MNDKPSIRNLFYTLDGVARLSQALVGSEDLAAQAFVAATTSDEAHWMN